MNIKEVIVITPSITWGINDKVETIEVDFQDKHLNKIVHFIQDESFISSATIQYNEEATVMMITVVNDNFKDIAHMDIVDAVELLSKDEKEFNRIKDLKNSIKEATGK